MYTYLYQGPPKQRVCMCCSILHTYIRSLVGWLGLKQMFWLCFTTLRNDVFLFFFALIVLLLMSHCPPELPDWIFEQRRKKYFFRTLFQLQILFNRHFYLVLILFNTENFFMISKRSSRVVLVCGWCASAIPPPPFPLSLGRLKPDLRVVEGAGVVYAWFLNLVAELFIMRARYIFLLSFFPQWAKTA